MRKAVFWSTWLVLLGLVGAWSVRAFRAPERTPLPDFDKRGLVLPQAKAHAPQQQAAMDRLAQRLPGVQVTFEGKLGSPRFVRNPNGFLTGPQGQGLAVSAAAAAAFPKQDPHRSLKAFLQDHADLFGFGPEALQGARLKREFVSSHNGMTTTVWQQELDGIPVFERVLASHVTAAGELVNVACQFLPGLELAAQAGMGHRGAHLAAPAISAAQAMAAAAGLADAPLSVEQLQPAGDPEAGPAKRQAFRAGPLAGDNEASLVWVPFHRELLRLCWQVVLTSKTRGEMFLFLVDSETGDVVLRRCLTEYLTEFSYNVFTSDSPSPFSPGHPFPNTGQPPVVARQLVKLSALDTNASPNGWINDGDSETSGNNVDAHLDWNADNLPDLPRPAADTNQVFDFPLDLALSPREYTNAAVVQLFYWNNWIHDKLYGLGFTEAAGNFQRDNFGRGGLGNDAVQADAQDGSGFNNANFSTPPDGNPGRMQMYIFNGPTPNRDGDLDAEVVLHEYVHGLSNRRVGGGVGLTALQSRGMGEGWSDFYPMALLSEASDNVDAVYANGGYLSYLYSGLTENYYYGIRRYPYTTDMTKNPLTFKDIDNTQASPHLGVPINPIGGGPANEVHNQGEVWCVTLWDARANLIKKYGYTTGNNLILQLVTDGMNLSPPNPNFLEARDAIIQADLVNNGGANFDDLWAAFAKRGMGGSASSPDSSSTVGVVESFDLPGLALQRAVATDLSGNGNGAVDFNECIDLNVILANNGRQTVSDIQATLSTTNSLVTVSQSVSTYPSIPRGATATNDIPFRFYTAPNFPCGEPIHFTLQVISGQDVRTIRLAVATGLVGPALRYDNNTVIPIPDADIGGISSPISVAGFSGNLAKAVVSLHIQHPFVYDLNLRLVAPDGTRIVLSEYNGFFGANFGLACSPDAQRTTFDDKAPVAISAGRPPYVGSFRPDEPLATFAGKSGQAVNGLWRLEVSDIFFFDEGSLQCWSLQLSPYLCRDGGGDCSTDLALGATNSPPPHIINSNLTYTASVTNFGPNTARNVTIEDPLPPNVEFVSANPTQGACTEGGGIVSCNLGTLLVGQSASVAIVVRPLETGILTNIITARSTVTDPNPTNNTVTLRTEILPPSPFVVSAGTFLVSESNAPGNGGIEIGETVTLSFALRNIGSLNTANLLVKLQATGGVTGPSPQQDYGILTAGGPVVARNFSFTAAGTNGGVITATLQLQDGTNSLGALDFVFGLGSTFQVANPAVINIPDHGAGSLYPSPLFVSDLVGLISSVQVTLARLSHTFPEDLDVLLVGPAGHQAMIMSDAGGGQGLNNATLTLDDAAALRLPNSGLVSGSYQPADYQPGDTMPAPAPPGPYATNLTTFRGSDPNGGWALYVADDTPGDQGRLAGGWTLNIQTFDPVNPQADLGLQASVGSGSVLVSSNLTYTVTVTNRGPEEAAQVVLTNRFNSPVNLVSSSGSNVVCRWEAGAVICELGQMPSQRGVVVRFTVAPQQAGTLTNTTEVAGLVMDFNTANNKAVTSVTVTAAADVRATVGVAPAQPTVGNDVTYTVTIANQGPSDATGLTLTNQLPAGVSFVSTSTTQGSCVHNAGRVTCSLGNLAAGASAQVVMVVTPPAVATLLNTTVVRAQSPSDPIPSNNAVTNTVSVVNPLFNIVASGASLVSESMLPPSGGIDSGETVQVSLFLRNIGSRPTTNLVATLLNIGGVTQSSGSATYGAVPASGPSVARLFTFQAAGANGGMINAVLRLQDGTTDLGTATYTFALSGSFSVANTNSLAIPDVGRAQPYPSLITVSNRNGLVNHVGVVLRGLSHAYPDDLDILLVGPHHTAVMLMSDVGGAHGLTNQTLTIRADATNAMPDFTAFTGTEYLPTDYEPNDFMPDAPAGPYGTDLAIFRDLSPNGAWKLFILDDSVGDLGQLTGGWELLLSTYGPVINVVFEPATLSDPMLLPDGQFTFTLQGTLGGTYRVEGSPDFETWTVVGDYPLTTTPTTTVTDSQAATLQRRFYRAVALEP